MNMKIINFLVVSVLFFQLTSCIPVKGLPSSFIATPSTTTNTTASDHMLDCNSLNSIQQKEQVGFRGVYSGKTSQNEARKLLGIPLDTSTDINGIENFLYDGFQINIKNQIVVSVHDNTQTYLLRDMIAEYGCPDFILTGLNPENLPLIMMGYLNLGVFMDVFEYPVSLDSGMYITYLEPTTMDKFLSSDYVKYIGDIRLVSWQDAIK